MVEMVQIVVLGAQDHNRFDDMMTLFGDVFDEPDTYVSNRPRKSYVDSLLSDDYLFLLAAEIGNKIVGGLAAYQLRKFEQERHEIYIYDLAVDRDYRRQGIATALINRLRNIAIDRGAYIIFVQADHGDDAAIALYSKLGMREDVLHFDILPAEGKP